MLNACKAHSDHAEGFEHLFSRALEIAHTAPQGLPFVEIGTRSGGSALLFLQAIKESGVPRPLITVDPYGIGYDRPEGPLPPMGEERYREAMRLLADYGYENGLDHIHYHMTSEDWMASWDAQGQMRCWVGGELVNSRPFAFVYLDGAHLKETVEAELAFFRPRMAPGGVIAIDDIENIQDPNTAELLQAWKWGETEGNRLYVKTPPAVSLANVCKNGGKARHAVVAIACGTDYRKIANLTQPSLASYAKRIGADLIIINESDRSTPHWMKFKLYDLLEEYDRIVYLDADLIVREDCPNLLEVVPHDKMGLFNEAPFVEGRAEALRDAAVSYSMRVPDWDGAYYNTGVMVLSRCHRYLFKHPGKEVFNFFEQSYINLMIAVTKTPVHKLSFRFNRMTCTDRATGEDRHGSWIIHYAGWQSLGQTLGTIRGDLRRWTELKPRGYPRLKSILIDVHGGMGDQAQAEPAIRFAMENVWTPLKGNFRIDVKTHWPRLFDHLAKQYPETLSVFDHNEWVPENSAYRTFNTLPGPETIHWTVVSNLLCHTIDFCSMALLRRTLPLESKQIRLSWHSEDMLSLVEKAGLGDREDLSSLLVLHAGLHWISKTLPVEWWQELLNRLAEEDLPICLIGLDEETRGVQPLVVPDGVIDLRNRTTLGELIALLSQAKMLISNDSGPIHLAGAFDNWIVLFPTCKHPQHLLPWRRGSQDYKTLALRRRDMIDDLLTDPTEIEPDPRINGEFLPIGMRWEDYLLDPEEVVERIALACGKPGTQVGAA